MKKILIKRFIEFVTNKNLINKNDRILVGVSGGVDSVVLLHLLLEIKKRFSLTLAVAHVNYCLRGDDSDKDQKVVENVCKKNGIPVFVHKIKLKKELKNENESVQIKAREIRYRFYDEICLKEGYTKIAIAHNANDNAETVMLNLFRGSGIDGLKGIPLTRDNIIRPIILFKREELLQYAQENEIKFRHDKSNFQDKYSRNFVRLRLLPLAIKRLNPKAIENINNFSQILSGFSDFIDEYVKNAVKSVRIVNSISEFSLDIEKLNNYINFIREKVIIASYFEFANETLTYDKVLKILKITESQTGKKIFLKKNIVLWKERNIIVFKQILSKHNFQSTIEIGFNDEKEIETGKILISDVKNFVRTSNKNIEFIDKDLVEGGFLVRLWKEGDYFFPLGMKGRKKISDFLTDIRIDSLKKESVFVLENSGKIVWIIGHRLDDRFKCTDKTKNVIKIEIKGNNSWNRLK
jgi:tRNA(Ile)-lysidine synthase